MRNFYRYLFFAIVLFYALFLSQFGFENWDTGYITSFSWRIVNGLAPYEDFIYKGPPVTLYLHAFWLNILPENGQFYFVRLVNYVMFALQIFFTFGAFDRFFNFQKLKIDKWALMCLAFVVSLLNFPAFPWPTTDGVLFASAALYLASVFSRPTFVHLFFIAICCMLSALTKQSFYLVPVLFLFLIFVRNGLRQCIVFLTSLAILALAYYLFINQITSWERYIQYTTGETHLYSLLYVGIYEYLAFFLRWYVTAPIIILTGILTYLAKTSAPVARKLVSILALVIMLAAIISAFCNEILVATKVAFVSVALLSADALIFRKRSLKFLSPAIVALGIAWCASISLGYSYPVFYASGIIAAFVVLGYNDLKHFVSPKIISVVALGVGLVAFSNSYRPYREKPLPELTQSMAEISPKLKYTKTHTKNFEKHLELKNLVKKYGNNFIVAPAIPMANYLFNEQSNLPADWIINTEVDRQYELFVNLAANEQNFIFLEKSYLTGEEMSLADKRETSEITWTIYTRFRKIDETKHFIIYNGRK